MTRPRDDHPRPDLERMYRMRSASHSGSGGGGGGRSSSCLLIVVVFLSVVTMAASIGLSGVPT